MANYILRKIDDKLWAKVKKKAADDNMPLRAVILGLLGMYVAGLVTIRIGVAQPITSAATAPTKGKR